jgi:uncharacterized Zn-finger protein
MAEIDHHVTSEIVCPYCGHVHTDSWERGDDDGEIECYECEREFRYSRYIDVTYNTEKIEGGELT